MLLSLFPHLCFKLAPYSSYSESHILCFKVAPCSSCSESHKVVLFILVGFFIIELGLYIPTMGFLKFPRSSWASKLDAHLVSFVELSYIYSSNTSVAWQSLLLALTSIDGHLPSPLINRVNVRLSPFLSSPHNPHHYSIPPIVLYPWLTLI